MKYGRVYVTKSFRHKGQPFDQVDAITNRTATCNGDSGGPLFQRGPDGRYAAIGVLSSGDDIYVPGKKYDPCQIQNVKEMMTVWGNHFVDVRRYISWICERTGACYSATGWTESMEQYGYRDVPSQFSHILLGFNKTFL